jgi:hypothetical protein
MRQIRRQALSVEKRAVSTADVLDQVGGVPLMDLAVMAGDTTPNSSIRCEVQVREGAAARVQATDVHLDSGRQLDLTSRRLNLDV